jgi:hypothetical protein
MFMNIDFNEVKKRIENMFIFVHNININANTKEASYPV